MKDNKNRKYMRIILIFLMFISCGKLVFAQGTQDTAKKPAKLIGEYTWSDWQKQAEWKDYTAPDYVPDFEVIPSLSNIIAEKQCRFILFAGDWCGDSKTEVPKIFKIFDFTDVNQNKYRLFGVDRNKRETSGIAEKFKIEKVPTLIILKDSTEAGRITEFPHKSWERDIWEILK